MAQSPVTPDPEPHARFPYVAALLCAASLGAAAWTWIRYSSARDVAVSEFYDGVDDYASYGLPGTPLHPLEGEYVRLRGVVAGVGRIHASVPEYPRFWLCVVRDTLDGDRYVEVLLPATWIAETPKEWVSLETWGKGVVGEDAVFVGRFIRHGGVHSTTDDGSIQYAAIDTTASRFHGASVAGLVVGAMGVFVFTVALRHWLNQRRAFRVEKAEAEQ